MSLDGSTPPRRAEVAPGCRTVLPSGRVLRCQGFLRLFRPTGDLPRRPTLFDVEFQLIAVRLDQHFVAGLRLSAQHHARELVLDEALDRPSPRSRAELRVVAFSCEQLQGLLREVDLDVLCAQAPGETVQE